MHRSVKEFEGPSDRFPRRPHPCSRTALGTGFRLGGPLSSRIGRDSPPHRPRDSQMRQQEGSHPSQRHVPWPLVLPTGASSPHLANTGQGQEGRVGTISPRFTQWTRRGLELRRDLSQTTPLGREDSHSGLTPAEPLGSPLAGSRWPLPCVQQHIRAWRGGRVLREGGTRGRFCRKAKCPVDPPSHRLGFRSEPF